MSEKRTIKRVGIVVKQYHDEALRTAGVGRVEFMLGDEHPPSLFEGNFHHLGTTRMHADPAMGVVDADCRVHGVRNLRVVDASVMPAVPSGNCHTAIAMIAERAADFLKGASRV